MTGQRSYRVGGHSPINIWFDPDGIGGKTGMQIATAQGAEWSRVLVLAANYYSARQRRLFGIAVDILEALPELVAARIAELGISQRAAAAGIGIPDSTLTRWPTGERGVRLSVAVKILAWLERTSANAELVSAGEGDVRHSPPGEDRRAVAVRIVPRDGEPRWLVIEHDVGLVCARSDAEVAGWPLMQVAPEEGS